MSLGRLERIVGESILSQVIKVVHNVGHKKSWRIPRPDAKQFTYSIDKCSNDRIYGGPWKKDYMEPS